MDIRTHFSKILFLKWKKTLQTIHLHSFDKNIYIMKNRSH
jgi:hypothetical protein